MSTKVDINVLWVKIHLYIQSLWYVWTIDSYFKYDDIVARTELTIYHNSAKRIDVTGNRFEWQLGENKVI